MISAGRIVGETGHNIRYFSSVSGPQSNHVGVNINGLSPWIFSGIVYLPVLNPIVSGSLRNGGPPKAAGLESIVHKNIGGYFFL
jgi:hypothetical protein